jgi:hypothetical protein
MDENETMPKDKRAKFNPFVDGKVAPIFKGKY